MVIKEEGVATEKREGNEVSEKWATLARRCVKEVKKVGKAGTARIAGSIRLPSLSEVFVVTQKPGYCRLSPALSGRFGALLLQV